MQQFRIAILVGQLTSSTGPAGFALLAGDAPVDSWLRDTQLHEPGMFI